MRKRQSAPSAIAYSYLRFSSAEQAKGDSLRRQSEIRDAWLKRNNVTLDTSLTLRDEGVSAFSGKHREDADRHALATFLRLVERGKIARGSYLIVESLDRLSREHIRPALTLLLGLIDRGIRVVQLLPVETIYDEGIEPMQLMMGIMELSRGHSESRMKSERLGRAWEEKRRRAADDGTPMTSRAPGWLRVAGGQFVVDEDRARVVRQIFDWAAAGYGLGVIVKRLNQGQVPTIGRAATWGRSSLQKILTTRAVFGEYQPHRGGNGNRKPIGEPIPNFYPPIISEERFHAVQATRTSRQITGGRPAKERINVFQGLLRDARDGGSMHQVDKGSRSPSPHIVPYRANSGVIGSVYVSFPLHIFEHEVLGKLRELDPQEILPANDGATDRVQALTGKLADTVARIDTLKAKMIEGDIASLVDVLRKLETKRQDVANELEAAKREAGSPLEGAWDEAHSLLDVLDKAKDQTDVRTRLRSALRRIAEGICCLFLARGSIRIAAVQIYFSGGGMRDYLIVHKGAWASANGTRPAQTICKSFPSRKSGYDLRDPKDAAALSKQLESMPIDGF